MLRLQTRVVRGLMGLSAGSESEVPCVRLCHERVKVRRVRSFSPAPLATIPATAAGFRLCGEGERSNGIISASGISLPVLVRHGNHLRVFAKKFSIVVDIGTGVG